MRVGHRSASPPLLSLIGALAATDNFLANFNNFLLLVLYLFIPWTAVNLVDYYIVRRGHYAIAEIFNPNGMYGRWGWRGIAAYLVGFAAMIPFFSVGHAVHRLGRQRSWTVPTSRCSSGCRSPGSSTGVFAAPSTWRRRPRWPEQAEELELEARGTSARAAHDDAGRVAASPRRSRAGAGRAVELVDAALADRSSARPDGQRVHRRLRPSRRWRRPRAVEPRRAHRARCAGVPVSVKDHIWLRRAACHERVAGAGRLRPRRGRASPWRG